MDELENVIKTILFSYVNLTNVVKQSSFVTKSDYLANFHQVSETTRKKIVEIIFSYVNLNNVAKRGRFVTKNHQNGRID